MSKRKLNKRYVFMLRWGAPCVAGAIALAYLFVVLAARQDPAAANPDGSIPGLTSKHSRDVTTEMVQFNFEDAAESAGISFQHFPATRRSMLPEDMGPGLAWGDYDNDGDPDLFLVNFRASILDKDTSKATGRCALYRNEGNGHFTDVSESTGAGLSCFGLAAAWGDFDNDGDLDLYVTCYGPNILLRNNGDGTFSDFTKEAGVGDDSFGTGCAWGDYDRDGDIDLYVCNYVQFEYREQDTAQMSKIYGSETPHTINPSTYEPAGNVLYRNNGDGTFVDVAEAVGVANPDGRSLQASWFDFNNDGHLDLYVANDISDNGVYLNTPGSKTPGSGKFTDIGASSLAADYRGAMGLAVGDYDHDGDFDLFVTHWVAQENAFFENASSLGWKNDDGSPRLFFMENAYGLGVGHISLQMVGWATGFADFDNDGHADLWVVNGHTLQKPDEPTQMKPQRMHVFRQRPPKGFFEMAEQACPLLAKPFVGRGGAHADYDGDGKVDLAVMVHGGRPMLLRNVARESGHWLAVQLRQTGGNTQALGARVIVKTGDLVQTAQVGADASYLSQHDTTLHFGLGQSDRVDLVTIHWPDGAVDTHDDVDIDRRVTFKHSGQYAADRD